MQERTTSRMRFSEAFGITQGPSGDWFDPHLSVDTKLFLDPLLLFLADDPVWNGAHAQLAVTLMAYHMNQEEAA